MFVYCQDYIGIIQFFCLGGYMGDQFVVYVFVLYIWMDVQFVQFEFVFVDFVEGEVDLMIILESLVQLFVGIFQIIVQVFVVVVLFKYEVDLFLGDDVWIGGLLDFMGQC